MADSNDPTSGEAASAPRGLGDDPDLNWWNERYKDRWHAERSAAGALIASREPERKYHIVAMSFSELSADVALADEKGRLIAG